MRPFAFRAESTLSVIKMYLKKCNFSVIKRQFPFRGDPEVASTLPGSPRDSLSRQATSHRRQKRKTPNQLPARWSEAHATWHGWTWRSACTLSALRLDQPPKPARGILHEPRMRRPFPMHPYRCRRQASEDSRHCEEDIRFHQMVFAPYAPNTTSPRTRSLRQELRVLHDCWVPDSWSLTSSIARPPTRRREETVRASERIRDIRLPVPHLYALVGDTSYPRTSALPLASDMSWTSRQVFCTPAMRRARWASVQFAPRASTPKLSSYYQRKPADLKPCLLPSSGGVEWSRQPTRGESALLASVQWSVTSWQKNIAQEKPIGSVARKGYSKESGARHFWSIVIPM